MRNIVKKIGEHIGSSDVVGFAGLGMLAYGIYRLHPPSMFIVCGAALIALAIAGARR